MTWYIGDKECKPDWCGCGGRGWIKRSTRCDEFPVHCMCTLSTSELARRAKLSRSTIYRWKRKGRASERTLEILEKLAKGHTQEVRS